MRLRQAAGVRRGCAGSMAVRMRLRRCEEVPHGERRAKTNTPTIIDILVLVFNCSRVKLNEQGIKCTKLKYISS